MLSNIALVIWNFTTIIGQSLECSLAKPQADQRSGGSNSQKSAMLPAYPPRVGYSVGMVGGPYGAVGAGYGTPGFAQVSNRVIFTVYNNIVIDETQ